MRNGLSQEVETLLQALFDGVSKELALELLQQRCSDELPFSETLGETGVARVQKAVLTLSGGDLDRLAAQVEKARKDWRDVLMAAGDC